MTFLKDQGLLQELFPLNSKGRSEYDGKLFKEALKHWFVPTEMIRDYYGENVAMYYSWMNFLISKCHSLLTKPLLTFRVACGPSFISSGVHHSEPVPLQGQQRFPFEHCLFHLCGSMGNTLCDLLETQMSGPVH